MYTTFLSFRNTKLRQNIFYYETHFERWHPANYRLEKTDSFPVTSGVLQGSVLAPTLLLLLVNDIDKYFRVLRMISVLPEASIVNHRNLTQA